MPVPYPPARRIDAVETILGHRVADPYRWLEDPDDPESRAWAAAEDDLCRGWMTSRAGRDRLRSRLEELLPGFIGPPLVIGDRSFFLQRLPGEDHPSLWVEERGERRLLIDPSALSEDHSVTLDGWAVSKEGERLAYLLSEGGDEESALRIMDVTTDALLDGPIDRTRYTPIAWLPGGDELYYVRRLAPGSVPSGEEQYHRRVYLHTVGSDPAEDVMVFGEGSDRTSYFGVSTSFDGRWVSVTVSLGTAPRNDCYLADLGGNRPARTARHDWRVVLEGVDAQAWPVFGRDGRIALVTDLDAPRRKLVRIDPERPDPSGWRDLLVEDAGGGVLDDVVLAGDAIVAVRSRHALSQVSIHDRATGALRAEVPLPGLGSAGVTGRPDEGGEVWIGYSDHVTPYRILHLDVASASVTVWADPPGWKGNGPGQVTARQVTYQSADGTKVRMFVIAAPAAKAPRPTILYGYGGFNVPLTPAYSSSILAWAEAGGVYAIANLRGGSEEGEEWHRDGMREHKQHSFDDVAAAAEWLVADGLTTADRLAVSGGSNGGLLVGAAITQRPELYAAAVCSAPLLDMVRYERFGLGATWSDEYGTAADPVELGWLLSYSPYHHVIAGTEYPAVLFTVFDGDSRVDPLHARKMCAALQWATTSDPEVRPVLLRREARVGHGARSVSRSVELAADELAWLAGQLGLELP
ncbi:MAG TPA: prolyl oligopeptidase family serine peptidase [Acidimicrobiales bacterium]